jgi:RNA polymerase sigma-70 factor (ECF subfamily)
MAEASPATTWLHQQIKRLRRGDDAARQTLIATVGGRMRRIAHHMLQGYPGVRAAADTDDVLQNTFVRLLAALRTIRPDSARDFFQLAAYLTRQELIDLLRRCARRQSEALPPDVADPAPTADHLDAWRHFHEAVERLPANERELMNLAFYHGWTQAQIAEILGVDTRTVRRYWALACVHLREALHDELDQLLGQ